MISLHKKIQITETELIRLLFDLLFGATFFNLSHQHKSEGGIYIGGVICQGIPVKLRKVAQVIETAQTRT